MQPNIDASSRSVALGVWMNRVYDSSTKTWNYFPVPTPIAINPVTKKVKIEVIPKTLSAPIIPDRMPIDANSNHVAGALTDDSDETLTPLSIELVEYIPALRVDASGLS